MPNRGPSMALFRWWWWTERGAGGGDKCRRELPNTRDVVCPPVTPIRVAEGRERAAGRSPSGREGLAVLGENEEQVRSLPESPRVTCSDAALRPTCLAPSLPGLFSPTLPTPATLGSSFSGPGPVVFVTPLLLLLPP